MSTRHSPSWWSAALTLTERAHLSRRGSTTSVESRERSTAAERWRKQRPFDRGDVFVRRLSLDELTEADFERVASSPVDVASDAATRPTWVATVDHASSIAADIERFRTIQPTLQPDGLEVARAFVEPFVAVAMSRLFARAREIKRANPAAPFEAEQATRLFEPALWAQLVSRAVKVVILELNVARVEGSLGGDTPEARCADFARQLRSGPTRDRVIDEYPVLARSIVTASEYWEQAAAEFLENLAADAETLSATFFDDAPLGVLESVASGVGDGHRHGRSVVVARMSSGARLVYKPRPLAVDLHFAELIDWLNDRGMTPSLRAVRSLDVGDHGWSEFVANAPCATPEAVGRFYERFGALLAILHALEATDFHYENVIAWGEYPALIDLEALFHPRSDHEAQQREPEWLGWQALQHSVLRAGVLPFRIHGPDSAVSIDLSAVGGRGGQMSPNRFPVLVASGTDEMRFSREHVRLPDTQNRPALGPDVVDPAHYTQRVVDGFAAAYRLLMRHRDELVAPDGPLYRFANDPIRVVLRPTRQYALILGESHHPDVLRDAIDRDRLIDKLWVAIPGRPEFERIVAFEHADLVNGDVPLFTSKPDSRDLWTTHGDVVESFFRRSGLESAVDRVTSLSEDDLLRQLWVVQASLVGLTPGRHGDDQTGRAVPAPQSLRGVTAHGHTADGLTTRPLGDTDYVDAALIVGRRITTLALRDSQHTAWLGLTLARDRDWVIQPVSTDFYNGGLGIALFLAYLDDVMPDDPAREIARSVVGQVNRRVETLIDSLDPAADLPTGALGAFGTLGGAVYVFAHLGALWNDHTLLESADRIVAAMLPRITDDRDLDLVNGAAGFAMAAAALHHVLPSASSLHAVRAAAERLVSTALLMPNGSAWNTTVASTQPLTGISHGASGMALALTTAASLLHNGKFSDLATDAARYERSTYDGSQLNWPDYRVLDAANAPDAPTFMWAWCHGAPGIGLARLAALAYAPGDELRADLEIALRSTAAFGLGSNDSLCHGDLGNLDLFLRARELGYRGAWEAALTYESAARIDRLRRGEWRCGIPGGVETPGFMMGLAGIGYGLLRMGIPSRIPSVMSLERPRCAICPRSDR